MFEQVGIALSALWNPVTIGYIFLGSAAGLVFGLLPGLGGTTAIAILLPLTYGQNPIVAMFFLAAVMGAVPFGGSISAILLNTPGTPQNAATCFDGHPMAQQGQANKAIGISATASGLGGFFGLFILMLLLPLVRRVVLLFGPPEFFLLVLFGLATVAIAAKGDFLKGLMASCIGILLSLIGFSPIFGVLRFTFDSDHLWDGIPLIPFLIGIFAVSELIHYAITGGKIAFKPVSGGGSVVDGIKEVFKHPVCFFRSSLIGTVIGIVPGIGGVAANFIAYVVAKERSDHPETFGQGNPEGLVAAEAANNAKDGGSLLPTVGFGIPGSAEMAVILGAFILHGLEPGPLLIKEHPDIVLALVVGLVISNIIASGIGLLSGNFLAIITRINVQYIIPVVLALCFVGSYALRENIWDVFLAFIFGVFGYGLRRYEFSNICVVIGFILGVMAERSFHQSLMVSIGRYSIFWSSPVSVILIILLVIALLYPLFTRFFFRRPA